VTFAFLLLNCTVTGQRADGCQVASMARYLHIWGIMHLRRSAEPLRATTFTPTVQA